MHIYHSYHTNSAQGTWTLTNMPSPWGTNATHKADLLWIVWEHGWDITYLHPDPKSTYCQFWTILPLCMNFIRGSTTIKFATLWILRFWQGYHSLFNYLRPTLPAGISTSLPQHAIWLFHIYLLRLLSHTAANKFFIHILRVLTRVYNGQSCKKDSWLKIQRKSHFLTLNSAWRLKTSPLYLLYLLIFQYILELIVFNLSTRHLYHGKYF